MTQRGQDPARTLKGCETLPPLSAGPDTSSLQRKSERETSDSQRKKATGRFAVLNSFVDCSLGQLARSEIAVWLVLYRDTRDGLASVTQSDIARRAGIDQRTVRRATVELEKRNLVKIVYCGGLNRGASKYRIFGTPPEK